MNIEKFENNNYWINLIEFKSIKKFHNFVVAFCNKNNLEPTFECFLNYGKGYVSDTYKFLYTANKFYLINSLAFKKYYYKLDTDFRNDIITKDQYKILMRDLKLNAPLIAYLKNIMKDDSVL